MSKPRAPFIQPGDAYLFDSGPIQFDSNYSKPFFEGVLISSLNEEGKSILQDSHDINKVKASIRSGLARSGIEVKLEDYELKPNGVELDSKIFSLSEDPVRFLTAMKEVSKTSRVDIGRLLFTSEAVSLTKEEVKEALRKGEVGIKDIQKTKILQDGTICLSLENEEWITEEILLKIEQKIQSIILNGKYALESIQGSIKSPLKKLNSKNFFVGSVKISVGPYIAIIEPEVSKDMIHLSSLIFDANRTTGIDSPRHVELFNKGAKPINLKNIKVKLKLYPSSDKHSNKVSQRLYNQGNNYRIIEKGVSILGATDLEDPEVYNAILSDVRDLKEGKKPQARIFTPKSMVEVPHSADQPGLDETILSEAAAMELPEVDPKNIPDYIAAFQKGLGLIGGDQSLKKVLVTENFPRPGVLDLLSNGGIGAFLAKGINLDDLKNEEQAKHYFDSAAYSTYRSLEKKGVNMFQVYNQGEKEEHLRKFHNGFWVKPEDIERCDNVGLVMAMYGSHVAGLEDIYKNDILKFTREIQKIFGNNTGIVQGSGPGVMMLAHLAAKLLNMISIGIGISAEKIGQRQNLEPTMNANFLLSARHTRQGLIEIINFLRIFNLGGGGTLEESAIGLVETKIQNSLATPFIFVDPTGELGPNKTNLWKPTVDAIKNLSEQKVISINEAKHTIQFLSEWASRYMYLVDSYEKAAEIARQFHSDPMAAWKDWGIPMSKSDPVLQSMYYAKKAQMNDLGFQIPGFIEDAIRPIL